MISFYTNFFFYEKELFFVFILRGSHAAQGGKVMPVSIILRILLRSTNQKHKLLVRGQSLVG
jgi:hypothetical protein